MTTRTDRFRKYAELGAEVRLGQLREEIAEIYRAFPALRFRKAARPTNTSGVAYEPGGSGRTKVPRRRRPFTAAQKKAISERMRKYWADRKKG